MKSSAQSVPESPAIISTHKRPCTLLRFCRVCGRPAGDAHRCPYCDEEVLRLRPSLISTPARTAVLLIGIAFVSANMILAAKCILPTGISVGSLLFGNISSVAEALTGIYGKSAAAIFILSTALIPFASSSQPGPARSFRATIATRAITSLKILAASAILSAVGYAVRTLFPSAFLGCTGITLIAVYPAKRIPAAAFAAYLAAFM